jgi:hypothetical protein
LRFLVNSSDPLQKTDGEVHHIKKRLFRETNEYDMKTSVSFRAGMAAALLLATLAASGCEGTSKPRGRIVKDGQPYKVDPSEDLRVFFYGDGEPGKATVTAADVSPDGSFNVAGPTETGLPMGKYRITVTSTPKAGSTGTVTAPAGFKAPAMGDKFELKFKDPANTPLTVEVKSSKTQIVIDVGKGTVTIGG